LPDADMRGRCINETTLLLSYHLIVIRFVAYTFGTFIGPLFESLAHGYRPHFL
jgi:hypothetical protein